MIPPMLWRVGWLSTIEALALPQGPGAQNPGTALDPTLLKVSTAPEVNETFEEAERAKAAAAALAERWFPALDLWLEQLIGVGLLLALCVALLLATRALRKTVIVPLIRRSANTWDDVFVDKAFFRWISYLPPTLVAAAIVHRMPGMAPELGERAVWLTHVIRNVVTGITTVTVMLAVGALIDAGHEIYQRRSRRQRPIKGYVSLVKLFIYVLGTVAAVAFTFGRDPSGLLAGIGALTAVLMLVFKDTILSVVASVQLAQNDMIRLGDWVEVPGHADGDVVDIALHTVKIQNWDRTISTIPTIQLVNNSFRNWRNMSEGPGRRLKRSLHLDTGSIRFLDEPEIERFSGYALLADYMAEKKEALAEANAGAGSETPPIDVRRLTNIGTFRTYVYRWLRRHPGINQAMTLIVRQLPPGPQGLPLEIYAFSKSTAWGDYEALQADIFDFLLAAVGEFGLRLYQAPAGEDLRQIRHA